MTYSPSLRTFDTVTSFHGGKFRNAYVFHGKTNVVWKKIRKIEINL